jgi:hypothetical protein
MTPARPRRLRALRSFGWRPLILVAALLALGATACTPEEVDAYLRITAPVTQRANDRGFDGDQMARVRYCESLNQYDFVKTPGSPYRGAYSIVQGVWDNAAAAYYPWLVGVDPATAEPWWQDAVARAIWADHGSEPWQECVGPNTWCAAWNCTPGQEPKG